jgi:hypothetical protein
MFSLIALLPGLSICALPINTYNIESSQIEAQTNLEIGVATTLYTVLSTCEYRCFFSLLVTGNQYTENGLGGGWFIIPTLQIENCSMTLGQSQLDLLKAVQENKSVYSFTLNQNIPIGQKVTIDGIFYGRWTKNESGIYTYHLGVNWGTNVGYQETRIRLSGEKIILHSTSLVFESIGSGMLEASWYESSTQGFSTTLQLQFKKSPNDYLLITQTTWNATVGESIEVGIRNIGLFDIEGWIIPNTSWIKTNVSYFYLIPFQEITVRFSITNDAIRGNNGTIDIVSPVLWERVSIAVYVEKNLPSGGLENLYGPLLGLGLIVVVLTTSIIGYQQREKIRTTLINRRKTATEDTKESWETIQSKWEGILPEQELEVLEILYEHGSMNQQTIANKIGVSKVTMSRLVTRLEMKKLINRNRFGVSKIIKLEKDRV